jgi:hypothetical protein
MVSVGHCLPVLLVWLCLQWLAIVVYLVTIIGMLRPMKQSLHFTISFIVPVVVDVDKIATNMIHRKTFQPNTRCTVASIDPVHTGYDENTSRPKFHRIRMISTKGDELKFDKCHTIYVF